MKPSEMEIAVRRELSGLTRPQREALAILVGEHCQEWTAQAEDEMLTDSRRAFRCGGAQALRLFGEGLKEMCEGKSS